MTRDLRLLLVEDNADDAELVLHTLRRGGFQVRVHRVDEREKFLAALAQEPWSLVISDYRMPRFTGMEALRLLRQQAVDIPFILISGTVGEEVAVEAMRQGAQDYLLKGNLTRLVPAVERELAEATVRQQRLSAESALRENERRYRLLVESVAAVPWEAAPDGRMLYIGPQAERIFAYPMGKWYESGFSRRIVHPDDANHMQNTFERAASGRERLEVEYRMRDARGIWHWFLTIGAIAQDANGKPVLRGFHIDITRIKEAEESRVTSETARRSLEQQLHHAQKLEAIGTLAGGIAHDFNNILTSIMGYAQLAARTVGQSADVKRYHDSILAASIRAQALVRQILTFSRRQEPDAKPMQVENVVRETVNLLRASIPSTFRIRTDIASHLPAVMADPNQIHQVLMNLGTNAFQAMERTSSGEISFSVETTSVRPDGAPVANTFVLIRVSDTGDGMNEDVQKRIFEPFFTTKPTGQGTGLGLSVVHGIVLAHSGSITVDSVPGGGTTFSVYLPAVSSASYVPSASPAVTIEGAQRIVCLVDDEEAIRMLGGEFLHLLGFRCEAFATAGEALQAVAQNPTRFCALISDLTMPGMTGIQLAQRLERIANHPPLVLSSGDLQAMAKQPSTSVAAVLPKPYTLESLAAALNQALANPTK